MGYHDIAKNKELMDNLKKMRDEAEEQNPALRETRERFSKPASPEVQKVLDESRKELVEELKKMKREGRF